MARVTAEEFQEKHARRLKGASEDIRRGVEKIMVSPTALAAAKKDKMRQKVLEAVDSGKWEAGLARVSKEQWQTAMLNKGVPHISEGIDGARDKVVSFASQLLPYIDSQVSTIKKMPDTTLEDNIQRMGAFARGMSKFKRTK